MQLLKRRKSEDLDLRPNPRKILIFQAFSHYQLCTLLNRTTHSTWLEWIARMSNPTRPYSETYRLPF
uniref:Uncharacterized protein n=1 Tax=Siphoviridae sp. ctMAv2 TaxID=2826258 RepID=A0A8S5LSV9_9CAUD|nr:MAG TPA: hypothetical protein [Siphoviridae sp. ctMAv2]